MVPRPQYEKALESVLDKNPAAVLLGPRQCGKTTLAKLVGERRLTTYFDLENPRDSDRLTSPMTVLERLSGLVIIDEIQRKPELFEVLRVLIDSEKCGAIFLLLGSASPNLVKGVSESLAGRIGFVDLSGFNLLEVGVEQSGRLWTRGGFPRSYLAGDEESSYEWRNDFMRTFLERDIRQLGITIASETLRRFWVMLAHYHGQVWNAAEFARSIGSSEPTARRYLDILSGAYMVRQLQPWHENVKKRQIKSPRVYIRDSGILHALLSLDKHEAVAEHPKLGASWEGFVIEQLIAMMGTRDFYFWGTHTGAEIDLLVFRQGKRLGFEMKRADSPRTTKSMRSAMADLALEQLYVIYPGPESYQLDSGIFAVSIDDIPELITRSQGKTQGQST